MLVVLMHCGTLSSMASWIPADAGMTETAFARRAKGHRTEGKGLGKVLDQTETDLVAPEAGVVPEPEGGTEDARHNRQVPSDKACGERGGRYRFG